MSLKRKPIGKLPTDLPKRPKKDLFVRPEKGATSAFSSTVTSFQFKPKASPACTRLTVWNVNGLMSVDKKVGRPDIMSLKTRFKHQYWGMDSRAGYAGTAILSKFKPMKVNIGIPSWESESRGRYVELEFDNVFIIGTYVPNAGTDFKNLGFKHQWNSILTQHLQELNPDEPIIWGGDFDCIMSKQDIDSTGKIFWNQMPALLEEERKDVAEILSKMGSEEPALIDAWRKTHPTDEESTHSSTKYGSWGLDSFIISASLSKSVEACEIRHELKALKLSDHWPVTLDIMIDMQLQESNSTVESSI